VDTSSLVAFPRPTSPDEESVGDVALAEIDMAIALVASRVARRVRLTSLPFVEAVAAIGLARARTAGMAFTLERAERVGVTTVTVGPVD
jgi:hypothetical protein